jgi:hypothetical protein
MNLRPLGYENRGARFNPRQHPTGPADTFRQPGPQPGWRRDCCAPLLTTLGLEMMYQERAARLTEAGPGGMRAVPHRKRRSTRRFSSGHCCSASWSEAATPEAVVGVWPPRAP